MLTTLISTRVTEEKKKKKLRKFETRSPEEKRCCRTPGILKAAAPQSHPVKHGAWQRAQGTAGSARPMLALQEFPKGPQLAAGRNPCSKGLQRLSAPSRFWSILELHLFFFLLFVFQTESELAITD